METTGPVPTSPPIAPPSAVSTAGSGSTSQIEQIVYLASLASRPSDIDPMLEPLRLITAKLGPSESPSEADNLQLNAVQRQLVHYLVEREPLRRFTLEALQQKLTRAPWAILPHASTFAKEFFLTSRSLR